MYTHNLNPVLLNLGPLEIRWYGLVYVLGFLITIWILQKYRSKLGISEDDVWDLLFYLILGVIIGSRLFEILWEPRYYLSNLTNIFKIWQGGMSFHGGFVGAVVAGWFYCKKKQINFWKLADLVSLPAIFALALGRIANFINGELVGRAWNGNWCVVFPDYDNACRHPSTLYAAGKRFLVFGWLLFLNYWKEFKPGFIFWNFVFFEGLGRIIVDFYRENALFLGFSLGQWLSLLMIIIALWVLHTRYKEDCKKFWKR